jgi:hypothetical protein
MEFHEEFELPLSPSSAGENDFTTSPTVSIENDVLVVVPDHADIYNDSQQDPTLFGSKPALNGIGIGMVDPDAIYSESQADERPHVAEREWGEPGRDEWAEPAKAFERRTSVQHVFSRDGHAGAGVDAEIDGGVGGEPDPPTPPIRRSPGSGRRLSQGRRPSITISVRVCACVCVHVSVCACVRACACVRLRARKCVRVSGCMCVRASCART